MRTSVGRSTRENLAFRVWTLARRLAVIPVVVMVLPRAVDAQATCDRDSLVSHWEDTWPLVEKYAPFFWFGPGERYLPTMPFFTAFDRRDNDGDGKIDFEDTREVAAISVAGDRPSWNWLDSVYKTEPGLKNELGAIFYRVRALDSRQVDDVWRYLISDEQAWKRFDIDPGTLATLRADSTQFVSIEFFAYYLNDTGLIGHQYDMEFAYLFAPKDPVLADRFRMVIGGGHTQRIPNNVLVLSGELALRETDNLNIIVELGDHSSAPDVLPYGVFNRGLDANWHAHDIWGTRDVQATAGMGALGRYESWMTFPRGRQLRTAILEPPTAGRQTIERRTVEQRALDLPAEIQMVESRYALIAAEPFECMLQMLKGVPAEVEVGSAIVDEAEEWLRLAERMSRTDGTSYRLNGFAGLDDDVREAAVRSLRRWNDGLVARLGNKTRRIGPGKVLVWRGKHYRSAPTRALKQHLFRPVLGSLQRFGHWVDLLNLWVTWQTGSALLVQGGFEVPAFWLPIRLPGYLEAQFGLYIPCTNLVDSCAVGGESFAVSLLQTGHYSRMFTWYGRVSFIPERAEVRGDPQARDWLIGAGLSIALSPFRLRLGLSTDLGAGGPRFGTTKWELIVSRL